jgi:hypothetical protein
MATDMKNSIHGGFTTLVVTLILLSILVAVSAFIGKVLIADKRLTLNEIEYRVAMAAAEKGIAEAMAELKVNPAVTTISGSISTDSANGSYQVTISPSGVLGVSDIVSQATLESGAEAVAAVQVAKRSVLNPGSPGPSSPFVLSGTLPPTGTITIVANPNGGGPGVPVSVWTKENVDISGNAKTCGLEEYYRKDSKGKQDKCSSSKLYSSSKDGKNADIVDNDTTNFPDDLVEFIFGYKDNADGWRGIESMGATILSDCSSLNNGSYGFYIVDGGCVIKGDVGSIEDSISPVILLVRNGDIQINGNGSVAGLLFSYYGTAGGALSPDVGGYDIKLNGTAEFYGSFITNSDKIKLPNGTYDAVYSEEVMCKLMACDESDVVGGSNPFLTFRYVPGSWKDWVEAP